MHLEARSQLEHPTDSAIANCSDKLHRAEIQLGGSSQIEVPGSSEVDHVMTELASSPGLNHDRPSLVTRRDPESAYTSKAKLNFGFREANSHQAPYSAVNTNPFAALEAVNPEAEDAKDNQEDLRESWTFQGRKKHTPRIASPRQALPQSPTPNPNHEVTPGGKKEMNALISTLLLFHLPKHLCTTRPRARQNKDLVGFVQRKK